MADDATERRQGPELISISVVIPARNEASYIEDTIRAILTQQTPACELIVVDNGSMDDTAAIAERLGARVVTEPRVGLPSARDAGWRAAHGETIVFLDADTIIPPGFLTAYQQALYTHPEAVAVSSSFRFHDGTWVMDAVLAVNAFLSISFIRLRLTQFVFGANFAVRRAALEQIGGFDTSISFYGEDTHLSQRLAKVGNILYLDHVHSTTSARRYRRQGVARTITTYLLNYLAVAFFHRPMDQLWPRKSALGHE